MDIELDAADKVIEAERTRLVWMSPSFMRASLEGRRLEAAEGIGARLTEAWPDAGASRVLSVRLQQMKDDPASGRWLLRAIVRKSDDLMMGYINFHGPPADGKAELGYTVFEPFRRSGYATEAALAMMGWANERSGTGTFVVSISPANDASLGLAAKLGFQKVGTQMDEIDGEEWVFELQWPGTGGANG